MQESEKISTLAEGIHLRHNRYSFASWKDHSASAAHIAEGFSLGHSHSLDCKTLSIEASNLNEAMAGRSCFDESQAIA